MSFFGSSSPSPFFTSSTPAPLAMNSPPAGMYQAPSNVPIFFIIFMFFVIVGGLFAFYLNKISTNAADQIGFDEGKSEKVYLAEAQNRARIA
jgi:hypothetical protein